MICDCYNCRLYKAQLKDDPENVIIFDDLGDSTLFIKQKIEKIVRGLSAINIKFIFNNIEVTRGYLSLRELWEDI